MTAKFREVVNSVPLGQKLGLLIVLLVAPTLVTGGLFYVAQDSQLEDARVELAGLRYTRPFVDLMVQLGAHRDAAATSFGTGQAGTGLVTAAAGEVDRAIGIIKNQEPETAAKFGTSSLVTEIVEGWESNVKTNWNLGGAAISLDMHTLLIAQVGDVIRLAARKSGGAGIGLAGTPFDSAVLGGLPGNLASIGQLGGFGVGAAGAGTLPVDQWDRLIGLMQEARGTTESLRATLAAAKKQEGSDVARQLRAATETAVTASEALLDASQEANAGRVKFAADPLEFRALSARALTAIGVLDTALAGAVETELEARLSHLESVRNFEYAAIAGLLVLGLGLAYLIVTMVNRQVTSMSTVLKKISNGDLEARAEVVANDELGRFAGALNSVLDNSISLVQSREERDHIQDNIKKLLADIEGVAQGDLTTEADVSEKMTGAIAASFNFMLVELRGIIRRVKDSASAANSAAAGAREATLRVADGSHVQSVQVTQASAAIDQMAQSIQQVTTQAAMAAHIAQDALRNAQLGSTSAQETIEGMGLVKRQINEMSGLVRELNESSTQIGEITQLIADISKRTSILALNASIQAAVSGEAGKGFGVVAEQVEELAARSSEAAKRVAGLTKLIQTTTGAVIGALADATAQAAGGETLATEARTRLSDIERVSQQLSGIVESILVACKQQSASSESITESMNQIATVTERTNQGAQEASSSIQDLTNLMEELGGSVSRFRLPATTSAG